MMYPILITICTVIYLLHYIGYCTLCTINRFLISFDRCNISCTTFYYSIRFSDENSVNSEILLYCNSTFTQLFLYCNQHWHNCFLSYYEYAVQYYYLHWHYNCFYLTTCIQYNNFYVTSYQIVCYSKYFYFQFLLTLY